MTVTGGTDPEPDVTVREARPADADAPDFVLAADLTDDAVSSG